MDQRARKLEIIKSEHALVVGVDVGKYRHWACLLDGRTELALGPAFAFQNSGEGFERLVSAVSKAQRKAGATQSGFRDGAVGPLLEASGVVPEAYRHDGGDGEPVSREEAEGV